MHQFSILSMQLAQPGVAATLHSFTLDAENATDALRQWSEQHPNDKFQFLKLENATELRRYKANGWDVRTI